MSDEDSPQTEPPEPGVRCLLFVAATAPTALRAMRNLEQCLHDHGIAADALQIVDVFREPERALAWRVFSTPMIVRCVLPEQRLYGDLADTDLLARFLLDGT